MHAYHGLYLTSFRMVRGVVTGSYARYTHKQPFTWQGPDIMAASGEGGEAYEGGDGGAASYQKPARQFHTRPWYFLVDRQVSPCLFALSRECVCLRESGVGRPVTLTLSFIV